MPSGWLANQPSRIVGALPRQLARAETGTAR
jgi:hypothetical protein